MTERKFTPPTEFPAEYVDGHGQKVVILGRAPVEDYPLIGYVLHVGDVSSLTERSSADAWTENGQNVIDWLPSPDDLHDTPKNGMTQYRKKPVVIEAYRIGDTGNGGWPDSIWEGVNDNKITLHLDRVGFPKQTVGYVEIHTLEGVMRGEVGDWIIRGVNGEFYPCKPDIFEKTYELVEEME